MADAAAIRREARRKKILENSHNRLQFISGKNNQENLQESPKKSSNPNESTENLLLSADRSPTKASLNNGIVVTQADNFASFNLESLLSTNRDIDASGDGDILNDLTGFIASNTETVQNKSTFWTKIIAYKYDIVLLSFIIQIFYCFSVITFENTYFFLPPFIYVITKLMWIPRENNSNIANAFLMLNGMSADRIHQILRIIHWVGLISQDVFLYLFVTIFTQFLYIALKYNLIT